MSSRFRGFFTFSYQANVIEGIFSFVLFALIIFSAANISKAQPASENDGHGKEWRQLTSTTRGATWAAIAANCPEDGATPCTGGGMQEWVWASERQVQQLMSYYEPAMATNWGVGGMQYFFTAQNFLSTFQPTFSFCGTYSCGSYVAGWTSSRGKGKRGIFGAVSAGNTPVSIDGSFGIGPASSEDDVDNSRGVWLWRATGPGPQAYSDSGTVANPSGGVAVSNVLANDWMNGARATTANVLLSQVSASHSGIFLDTSDGSIDVSSGTPSGNYSLTYRICDIANTSSCDSANVSVRVNTHAVSAAADEGWVSPSTGGVAVANVLANDRLSGVQATTANVSLSLVSASPGISLNTSNGAVSAAAGIELGTHYLMYQICDRIDTANCGRALVSVTAGNYVIDAVNDYVRAASKTASTPLNVLANDTFNGARATTPQVTLTQVSAPIYGITLNTSTGWISVGSRASSGIYYLTYKICETAAPTNCDTAVATIELSGRGS